MLMNTNAMNPPAQRFVSLHTDQVRRLRGAARLLVTHGTVWLTLTGQTADHLLLPGDRFTIERGSDALVESMSGLACIVVTEDVSSWTHRVAATLRAASRRFAGTLA